MVRIDLSEYMEKHSVSRLVGSPPGLLLRSEFEPGSNVNVDKVETKEGDKEPDHPPAPEGDSDE